jgi:hypothetical protein
LAADFTEIAGLAGEEVQPEMEELAAAITAGIAKNVTSKTWLRGVSEAINVFEDPDRYGSRWLQRFTGSLVPTLSATTERAISPEFEQVWSVIDSMKARTPWLSSELPPRRDIWGEVLSGAIDPSKGRTWAEIAYSMASPVYISKEKGSPIDAELTRLKIGLSKPMKVQNLNGVSVRLDPQEYDRLLVLMNEVEVRDGKNLKDALNELVKSHDYKQKRSDIKEAMIREMRNDALARARQKLIDENVEIANFVAREKTQIQLQGVQ